jgi:NADPH-dependent 2,4-dienoyl-CoA reductase/sulfur reductase-like enzyme
MTIPTLTFRAARRRLLAGVAGAMSALGTPMLRAQPAPKVVVVVGGGFGGATCAKYIRQFSPSTEVVVIEPLPAAVLCPMSSRVIQGEMLLRDITRSYDSFASRHGIRWLRTSASALDAAKGTVKAGNTVIKFDRIVVAPGIEFLYDQVPGMESAEAQASVLHAWKAGEQTVRLRQQLHAMRKGGVFALHIPKVPFRCPPGPYERASLIADFLTRANPSAKLLVLDSNVAIQSKKELFETAWRTRYPKMIEYVHDAEIESVDAARLQIKLRTGAPVRADVINLIPPQSAGAFAKAAGLANVGARWCGVDFLSYESLVAPGVHVIGDAVAGSPGMPKSAHMANAEAKVCAMAVASLLAGEKPAADPILPNTCYSFVSRNEAIHVAQVFRFDAAKRAMVPAAGAGGISPAASRSEAIFAMGWANNIADDSFG